MPQVGAFEAGSAPSPQRWRRFPFRQRSLIMGALTTPNSFFDEILQGLPGGFYLKPLHGDPLPAPGNIKINVKESAEAYTVQAEIPGVDKNDIQVSVDHNIVTLRAEIKQFDKNSSNERLLREERYYGSVSRSFQLASDIDESKVKARYEQGVLNLTLPKKEMAASRRISVE
ncbi:MAG TPA: Hsp20/alpha crystallin family protein [Burkholderiaceae bacterium]